MGKGKNIKNTYPVLGMSCASCAARVDKTLNGLPGVYWKIQCKLPPKTKRFCPLVLK